MNPLHGVSWMGEAWECLCGFRSLVDNIARIHYYDSGKTISDRRPTDFQMSEQTL